MFKSFVLVSVILCLPILCQAADWPQWRGPSRNGIAPQSPPLLDEFPKDGPKKLWTSEAIPGSDPGGYGSCAVADGKVYLYVNHAWDSPKRILTADALNGAGYAPDMPAALSQAVENARTSAARAEIKDSKVLDPWITKWINDNVKPEDKKFAGAAKARLRAGADAIPLDILAKLKPIQDRTFADQAQLDEWLKSAQIADKVAKQVTKIMLSQDRESEDLVYCLDADTGKTLWKTPLDSKWFWKPCSATPTIADGKCYVWNSQGRVHCLDAKDGKELWKSESQGSGGFRQNRSSSVLLIEGLAVVEGEGALHAFNAQDGKLAWSVKEFPSEQSSAVAWTKDGKNYILANAGGQLACLDPKDGKVKWTAKSGPSSFATPSTDGDFAALATAEAGLIGYTLSAQGATEAWKLPFKDKYTGAIIKDGYIYVIGGGREDSDKGRALCVEQKSGKVAWEQVVGEAQLSNPLLADGKIIAVNGEELLVFKATPDKYTLVGKAKLALEKWSSPSFADGKVFLRTGDAVVCYDLKK
jgi:outer membrane protein assembly factor BamB